MLLDDTARCAGTRQPLRNTVLGLCYGCSRYTLGPASLSGVAYLQHEPPYTPAWTCDERLASVAGHKAQHDSHAGARAPLTLGVSAVSVCEGGKA